MNCDDFSLLMPDALSGRLDASEAGELKAHLEECAECRAAFGEMAHASALLERGFTDMEPKTDARLLARVLESAHAKPPVVRRGGAGVPAGWASAAAAVALVAVIAGLVLSQRKQTTTAGGSKQEAAGRSDGTKETAGGGSDTERRRGDGETGGRGETTTAEDANHSAIRNPQSAIATTERPRRDVIDDQLGLALLKRTGLIAICDPQRQAWRSLVAGERIPYGWAVRTASGARAELAFGESRIRLDENTSVTIAQGDDKSRVANLSSGRVRVDLLRAEAPFRIASNGGVVELTGTIVEVDAPAPDLAFVTVLEGHVKVTAKLAGKEAPMALTAAAGQEALLVCTATRQALEALPAELRARALKLAGEAGLVLPAGAGNGEKNVAGTTTRWDADLDAPRPNSASVGQLIVRDEQGREAEPLAIESMTVHTSIRGPEALTRVDQVFLNQTPRVLEGTFYFPLPPGAAIARFAMYVDDKTLIEGEVVERGKAREVFEFILHQKRDPALLEWMEGNLFKTRIFPIAPNGKKRVIMEYTELLPAFYDTRRYVLPLVSELSQKTPIGQLNIRVDLESGDGSRFTEVLAPSYRRETFVAGENSARASASMTQTRFTPRADFVVNFSAPRASPLFAAAFADKSEAPYVLLGYQARTAFPGPKAISTGSQQQTEAARGTMRDVLLIAETSGARTPQDLDAQARTLKALLASLSPETDRVALAAADISLTPFLDSFCSPRGIHAKEALKALAQRPPLGALDLGAAVRGAAQFFAAHSDAGRKHVVIFVGGGMPAYGVLDSGTLAEEGAAELSAAKASLVAVGLGRAVDALALSELARRTGGFYRPMRVEEGLDEAAFLLGLSLQAPLVENPLIESAELLGLWPENLGALIPGQEVFLFARAKMPTSERFSVAIKGTLAGESCARVFDVSWPKNMAADPAVGRFWARAQLDRLLAQPQTPELRRQIIDLAQAWTLMSPYTSLLVLESEADYGRYGIDRRKRRPLWGAGGSRQEAVGRSDGTDAATREAELVERLANATTKEEKAAIQDEILFLRRTSAQRVSQEARAREDESFKLRLSKLTDQVQDLMNKQAYRQAEKLAERLLQIDPLNSEVEKLKAEAGRKCHEAEKRAWINSEYQEQATPNRELASRMNIPHADYLIYPDDWKEITQRSRDVVTGGIGDVRRLDGTVQPKAPAATDAIPVQPGESNQLREASAAEIEKLKQEVDELRRTVGQDGATPRSSVDKALEGRYGPNASRDVAFTFQDAGFPINREVGKSWEQVEENNISYAAQLLYPPNWDQISRRAEQKAHDVVDLSEATTDFPGPRLPLTGEAAAQALRSDLALQTKRIEKLKEVGVEIDNSLPAGASDEEKLKIQTKRVEQMIEQGVSVSQLIGESALSSPPIDAQVLAVRPEIGEVMLSAGSTQNVTPGTQITLSRGDQFVARVQVDRVYGDMCSAKVMPGMQKLEINVNDVARAKGAAPVDPSVEIRRKLAQRVSFDFVDKPLAEAVSFLREKSGVAFHINPRIDQSKLEKITLRVQDMEAETALKWVLRLVELQYRIKDGMVVISAKADGTPEIELEIYDVRDLRLPGIQQLIKTNVNPEAWKDPSTSLEEQNGKLIVMQRPVVHAEIKRALRRIRDVQALNAPKTDGQEPRAKSQEPNSNPPKVSDITVAVELTCDQIAALLASTPNTPANAARRLELTRKLAALSTGGDIYRALATGIGEFGGNGAQAEALAREVLGRLKNENDAKALDSALEALTDPGLRAAAMARRGSLETEAGKRAEWLDKAYRESESEPAYLQPLCAALSAAARHKDVIARLERALRKGVSQPWMWTQLAQACQATGDSNGALRAVTQAVALRPKEAEPRRQLGSALAAMGRGAEAIEQLRVACELGPENAGAHRELLNAALKQKDFAACEWACLRMIDRDWAAGDGDVRGEAHRQLASLLTQYKEAGKTDAAEKLAQKQALLNATDVVIVMSWDTDKTDIDLHVDEPHHHISYQNMRSFQGGVLDRDVTTGFGPETYALRRAAPGEYVVKARYYRGEALTKVKVAVTFHKGAPTAETKEYNIELKRQGEEAEVLRFKL
ncbi:MAG TPA: VIT domain-containing protein [Planctomycetota bacterium]|jgi:Flp pilus assembly protein TadD